MNSMSGGTGFSTATGSDTGMRGIGPGMKAPKGYRAYQQYSPEQMQLFQSMFGNVAPGSYLARLAGGDQSLFQEMEAPALKQFQGEMGNLASRFSGMGLGARRSSGFQNTTTAAAQNFATQLQAQRQALQRQAIMDLMGLSSDLLQQRPYGLAEKRQRESSGWGGLAGAALGGLGGFALGGPAGALGGAQVGYGIGSNF